MKVSPVDLTPINGIYLRIDSPDPISRKGVLRLKRRQAASKCLGGISMFTVLKVLLVSLLFMTTFME